jgi:hypothetical protein
MTLNRAIVAVERSKQPDQRTMGRLRLSSFRRIASEEETAHPAAQRVLSKETDLPNGAQHDAAIDVVERIQRLRVKDEKKDEAGADQIELLDNINRQIDDTYPILPRSTKDSALPVIPASEIRRRNGEGRNRLCAYLVIPTHLTSSPTQKHFPISTAAPDGNFKRWQTSTDSQQHPRASHPSLRPRRNSLRPQPPGWCLFTPELRRERLQLAMVHVPQ